MWITLSFLPCVVGEFSGMGGLIFGGEIIGGILEVGSYFGGRILGH